MPSCIRNSWPAISPSLHRRTLAGTAVLCASSSNNDLALSCKSSNRWAEETTLGLKSPVPADEVMEIQGKNPLDEKKLRRRASCTNWQMWQWVTGGGKRIFPHPQLRFTRPAETMDGLGRIRQDGPTRTLR